ncbi:hypothetical protein [Amycolatopsis sp. cmx-4-54]|uniref:hypothetical protein n=1 Tax=Amycolatopsis sp. cmx-4-54 TaxID=2790936 RepID=UPI00397B297F
MNSSGVGVVDAGKQHARVAGSRAGAPVPVSGAVGAVGALARDGGATPEGPPGGEFAERG